LKSMVRDGAPLTRDEWIRRAYLTDGPPSDEEWNAEHEDGVPRIFRQSDDDD
jgi:hypothetical protein